MIIYQGQPNPGHCRGVGGQKRSLRPRVLPFPSIKTTTRKMTPLNSKTPKATEIQDNSVLPDASEFEHNATEPEASISSTLHWSERQVCRRIYWLFICPCGRWDHDHTTFPPEDEARKMDSITTTFAWSGGEFGGKLGGI